MARKRPPSWSFFLFIIPAWCLVFSFVQHHVYWNSDDGGGAIIIVQAMDVVIDVNGEHHHADHDHNEHPNVDLVVTEEENIGKKPQQQDDDDEDKDIVVEEDDKNHSDSRTAMNRILKETKKETNDTITKQRRPLSLREIFMKSASKALGGGLSGAFAGMIQVVTLMWIRTIVNYQSRYGTSFIYAFRTLYHEGGIARFYKGVSFAIIQAPASRFVSTAANDGITSLLHAIPYTNHWGPAITTMIAAVVVGFARILLMPIDTMKTVLQVDSTDGYRHIMKRLRNGHIGALYEGAIAQAISAIVGHYPWFYIYNYLSTNRSFQHWISSIILRHALIGIIASMVSDTIVNAIRVIKTTKQSLASQQSVSYHDTIKVILAADGIKGLFGRGLVTRMIGNALQSLLFTIIWRSIADRYSSSGSGSSGSSSNTNSNQRSQPKQ